VPFISDHYLVYLVIAAAATLGGLSRGFSGFGAAMVFMPIASAVLTPVVATPVLLLTDLISSSLVLRGALAQFCWRDMKWILAGALIGFPLGIEILTRSDPIAVRWMASIIMLASLIFIASGWRYRGPRSSHVMVSVGLTSGTMSGVAQIGNPPVIAYWLGTDMPSERMRPNMIVYFSILTAIGVAIFLAKGLMTLNILGLVCASLPGYLLGMSVGNRFFPLASPATFRKIAFALIVASIITGLPLLDQWLRHK
jgi:uncharacterized membrane protein YfcA